MSPWRVTTGGDVRFVSVEEALDEEALDGAGLMASGKVLAPMPDAPSHVPAPVFTYADPDEQVQR